MFSNSQLLCGSQNAFICGKQITIMCHGYKVRSCRSFKPLLHFLRLASVSVCSSWDLEKQAFVSADHHGGRSAGPNSQTHRLSGARGKHAAHLSGNQQVVQPSFTVTGTVCGARERQSLSLSQMLISISV